jgi:heat shock protein HslJ
MRKLGLLLVVALATLGACGDAEGGDGIVGPTWELQEFLGGDGEVVAPDDPTRYTVTLNEDGTANLVADCNQVNATYTLEEPELSFELGASTLVACEEGSFSDRYLLLMGNAVSYVMDDGDMVIATFADAGTLRFSSN